jgi:hypothetical protein
MFWPCRQYLFVLAAPRKASVQAAPSPLIISENGVVHSSDSGPGIFEFQTEQMRPSPTKTLGQNYTQARRKRKNMTLPDVVSASDARTPLVQKSVQRSTRLSVGKEGYCPVTVMLEKEPSKRTKNWVIQIDEATGKVGPVSIVVLQDWGVKCGADPWDLTEDALMQAPPHSSC